MTISGIFQNDPFLCGIVVPVVNRNTGPVLQPEAFSLFLRVYGILDLTLRRGFMA